MEQNQPNPGGLPSGVTEVIPEQPVQQAAPVNQPAGQQENIENQPGQSTETFEAGGEIAPEGTGNFFKDTNWLFMMFGTVFIWGVFAYIDFTRRRAFLHSDKTQEQDAKIKTLQNDMNTVRQELGA